MMTAILIIIFLWLFLKSQEIIEKRQDCHQLFTGADQAVGWQIVFFIDYYKRAVAKPDN